ncbi:MAG TPA: hypothetical protein VM513_03540 [Kofleriaceae bacterium]|jgi:hypothetical protein|nr:hypothetical protein [Kofleriaceae bacterium]
MSTFLRSLSIIVVSNLALVATAAAQAQPAEPTAPTMPTAPAMPADPAAMPAGSDMTATTQSPPPPPEDAKKEKQPKAGDFDAGGRVRLPNGPDETGQFATFNWIAADLVGRYFLLPSVSLNGTIPLAVKTPELMGVDPKLFGGMSIRLDAKLPEMPKLPFVKQETEVGLSLTGAYMREGAMLLSDKDYPLFTGDLKPGLAGALIMKVKLSSVVDFSLLPAFVFQSGEAENLTAVQVPMSLILKAGSLLKLSLDTGVFTGDDVSLRPSNGGRIYLGAAVDVKIGPIITHVGAGFASLLTDEMGLYPTIGDSVYLDLNVKYAK